MWQDFISFLQENMLACPSKTQLGMECPGCGMQRSFVLLLQGKFAEAWYMYPAIYPFLAAFIFLPFQLRFKFKAGTKILLVLCCTSAAFSIVNFILKLY